MITIEGISALMLALIGIVAGIYIYIFLTLYFEARSRKKARLENEIMGCKDGCPFYGGRDDTLIATGLTAGPICNRGDEPCPASLRFCPACFGTGYITVRDGELKPMYRNPCRYCDETGFAPEEKR